MTQTRTLTEHTTEINTIMCTALIVKTGLLRLAFDLGHPERERALLCHQTDTTRSWAQCANHPAYFWLWCAVTPRKNTSPALIINPGCNLNLKQQAPVQLCFREAAGFTLIKVHVRLVFCRFGAGVALCSRSSPCLHFLPGVSPVRWRAPFCLGGRVLPWELHLGFGLAHSRVTGQEKLLWNYTKHMNYMK